MRNAKKNLFSDHLSSLTNQLPLSPAPLQHRLNASLNKDRRPLYQRLPLPLLGLGVSSPSYVRYSTVHGLS